MADDGLRVETIILSDEFGIQNSGKREMVYNSAGQLVAEKEYDKYGDVYNERHYNYDSLGNKVSTEQYYDGKFDGTLRYEYDSSGNQVSMREYGANGTFRGRTEYQYDELGYIKTETSYSSPGAREPSSQQVYEYDSSGNRLSQETYLNGEFSVREEYEYDTNGNITCERVTRSGYDDYTKEIQYDSNGNKVYEINGNDKFIYKYDSSGNLTEKKWVGKSNGGFIGHEEYSYDSSGRVTSKRSYDEKGRPIDNYTYIYDSSGKLKERKIGHSGSYTTEQFEYDSVGNLIATKSSNNSGENWQRTYSSGIEEKTIYYKCDESGHIECKETQELGKTISYEIYSYDENGNQTCELYDQKYGELLSTTKYDKNGRMISKTNYNSDKTSFIVENYGLNGEMYNKQVYTNGKLVSQETYHRDENGNNNTYTYIYDEKGRVISEKLSINGDYVNERKNEYDEEGNLISSIKYNQNGEIIFSESTMDAVRLLPLIDLMNGSSEEFSGILSEIGSACSAAASAVSSEDSGLAGTLNNMSQLCSTAKGTLSQCLGNLGNNIGSFIKSTLRNEEEAEQQLGAINDSLTEISDIFSSLSN